MPWITSGCEGELRFQTIFNRKGHCRKWRSRADLRDLLPPLKWESPPALWEKRGCIKPVLTDRSRLPVVSDFEKQSWNDLDYLLHYAIFFLSLIRKHSSKERQMIKKSRASNTASLHLCDFLNPNVTNKRRRKQASKEKGWAYDWTQKESKFRKEEWIDLWPCRQELLFRFRKNHVFY